MSAKSSDKYIDNTLKKGIKSKCVELCTSNFADIKYHKNQYAEKMSSHRSLIELMDGDMSPELQYKIESSSQEIHQLAKKFPKAKCNLCSGQYSLLRNASNNKADVDHNKVLLPNYDASNFQRHVEAHLNDPQFKGELVERYFTHASKPITKPYLVELYAKLMVSFPTVPFSFFQSQKFHDFLNEIASGQTKLALIEDGSTCSWPNLFKNAMEFLEDFHKESWPSFISDLVGGAPVTITTDGCTKNKKSSIA